VLKSVNLVLGLSVEPSSFLPSICVHLTCAIYTRRRLTCFSADTCASIEISLDHKRTTPRHPKTPSIQTLNAYYRDILKSYIYSIKLTQPHPSP
jgi:hypothetical protein